MAEEITPFSFVNQYHQDTIDQRKALRRTDGRVTTVNAIGVPVNGKIYMVPGFNRDTGQILTEAEAYRLYAPEIPKLEEQGKIVGIEDNWVGDINDHPANVAARENHKFMDEAEIDEDAITWNEHADPVVRATERQQLMSRRTQQNTQPTAHFRNNLNIQSVPRRLIEDVSGKPIIQDGRRLLDGLPLPQTDGASVVVTARRPTNKNGND
jgi:hypothetical protein